MNGRGFHFMERRGRPEGKAGRKWCPAGWAAMNGDHSVKIVPIKGGWGKGEEEGLIPPN